MGTTPSNADPAELARLSDAVSALVQGLNEFQDLVHLAQKSRLSTEKNIERVARAIQEAAVCQERVDASLRALIAAIQGVQGLHLSNVESLQTRAQEVQGRMKQVQEMQARFDGLGMEVRELHALLKEAAWAGVPPSPGADPGEPVTMKTVLDRMTRAIDQARELRDAASAVEMLDLAREAESMRQQIESSRTKLARSTGAQG